MEQQTRNDIHVRTKINPNVNAGKGQGNLQNLRREGESAADACDEAIESVLSGDRLKFLKQSRQQGGQ